MNESPINPAAEYNRLAANVRARAFKITGNKDNPFQGLSEEALNDLLLEILFFETQLIPETTYDPKVAVAVPPKLLGKVADFFLRNAIVGRIFTRVLIVLVGFLTIPGAVTNQSVPVMEMQLDDAVQNPIGAMEDLLPSPKDFQTKMDLLDEITKPLPAEDGTDEVIELIAENLREIRRELFELHEKDREEEEEEKKAAS